MKKRTMIVMMLAVIMMVTREAIAAARSVVTKPFEVTVYPAMARVERRGTIRLPAGQHTLTIPDLPGSADEASLRIVVSGPKGTKLNGDRVRTIPGIQAVEGRTKELMKKIRALEDRKSAIEDRETARTDELALLRQTPAQQDESPRGEGKPTSLEERAKGAEAIGRRIRHLLDEGRKDAIAAREIDEQLLVMHREAKGTEATPTDRREVEIELELLRPAEIGVSLSYAVDDVEWEPVYDLILDQKTKVPMVSVVSAARIGQRTGEDWNGVRLILSTAQPAVAFAPRPEIPLDRTGNPPSFPGGVSEKARKERKSGGADYEESQTMVRGQTGGMTFAFHSDGGGYSGVSRVENMGVARSEPKSLVVEPIAQATATSERNPFAVQFRMPGKVTVRSGPDVRRVQIAESTHSASLYLIADPSKEAAVRLEARLVYRAESPLLRGDAQIFQGPDFAGTTRIPSVASGEELTVGFGIDALVKLERKLEEKTAYDPQWTWFGTSSRTWRWRTTLVNGHAEPRSIEVREWVPTWRDSAFKVTPFLPTPGLLPDDPKMEGLKRWRVLARPGEPEQVDFGFTIQHPPAHRPPEFG